MWRGGSLSDLIERDGGLGTQKALRLHCQVLDALAVAHANGVVHRDIKPQNILITRDGIPKVTDFGIARVTDQDRALTRTGAVMGTWGYMAPALRTDATKADARTDLYAVGTMLYVALTGKEPFDLYATNLHAKRFVGLPAVVNQILVKAAHFESEERYASAKEMRAALLKATERVGTLYEPIPEHDETRSSATLSPPTDQLGLTAVPSAAEPNLALGAGQQEHGGSTFQFDPLAPSDAESGPVLPEPLPESPPADGHSDLGGSPGEHGGLSLRSYASGRGGGTALQALAALGGSAPGGIAAPGARHPPPGARSWSDRGTDFVAATGDGACSECC